MFLNLRNLKGVRSLWVPLSTEKYYANTFIRRMLPFLPEEFAPTVSLIRIVYRRATSSCTQYLFYFFFFHGSFFYTDVFNDNDRRANGFSFFSSYRFAWACKENGRETVWHRNTGRDNSVVAVRWTAIGTFGRTVPSVHFHADIGLLRKRTAARTERLIHLM